MGQKAACVHTDYAWYKSHGICVKCHREKASPERVLCAACTEAVKEKKAQFFKDNPGYRKAFYERRKAQGICVFCKKPAVKGRTKCELHLAKQREYNRKSKERSKS